MRGFAGEEFFLHNGYPALVESEGVFYPTVEHAFAASRTKDLNARVEIRNAPTHQHAAMLGRRFQEGPPEAHEGALRALTRQKFTLHTNLGLRLVQTGKRLLIHEDPHDLYFGTWNGRGENRQGLILMELRAELRTWL